jgi:transposase
MRDTDLFQLALGLAVPWLVEGFEFDPKHKRLDIHIGFRQGGKFPCSECGRSCCGVHDTVNKRWLHLSFLENETVLHVSTPRKKGVASALDPGDSYCRCGA